MVKGFAAIPFPHDSAWWAVEYPEAYPHYLVKRSTLHCDREGGRNEFVWNVWKVATEGQNYRCLQSFRTEAEGHAAVEADRLKVPHY